MGKTLFVVLVGAALLSHAEMREPRGRTVPGAIAMENLGVAQLREGHLSEALPLLEQALTDLLELAGADSPEVLQSMRNLAPVYGNLAAEAIASGDLEVADRYARRGVALAELSLPPVHPTRAALLNNLAQACRFAGRYQEAETHYRTALWIWEQTVGESHPDYARGLMNLAAFYHERGREAGAEQLYLRASVILAKREPLLAAVVRNELADVFRAQLRYTEAKRLANETLTEMERALPADDPRLARARANRSRLAAETAPRQIARRR